jgi:hypothetical protein
MKLGELSVDKVNLSAMHGHIHQTIHSIVEVRDPDIRELKGIIFPVCERREVLIDLQIEQSAVCTSLTGVMQFKFVEVGLAIGSGPHIFYIKGTFSNIGDLAAVLVEGTQTLMPSWQD